MYYIAQLKEEDLCTGCGICILSCPEGNAIKLKKLSSKKKGIEIYELRCKGCGLCVELCPKKALETVRV